VIGAGLYVASTASSSGAQDVTHTFLAVDCTAVVGVSTLHQIQDITIEVIAPDSVTPGQQFTITIPGGSATLPTRNGGLSITTYSNLFQVLQLNGANFAGNIVNPGNATFVPSTLGASAWSTLSTFGNGVYVYIDEASHPAPPAPVVPPDWHYFRSIQAANTNHPPATSPTWWTEVTATNPLEPTLWHAAVTYNTTNLAYTSFNGTIYKSIATPNLGPSPTPARRSGRRSRTRSRRLSRSSLRPRPKARTRCGSGSPVRSRPATRPTRRR